MANVAFGTAWFAIPNTDLDFGTGPYGMHKVITIAQERFNQSLIRVLPGTRKKNPHALEVPGGSLWHLKETGYFLYNVYRWLQKENFDTKYINLKPNRRYPPQRLPDKLEKQLINDLPQYITTYRDYPGKVPGHRIFSERECQGIYDLYNKKTVDSEDMQHFIETVGEMLQTYAVTINIPDAQLNQLDRSTFLRLAFVADESPLKSKSFDEFVDAFEAFIHYFISATVK